jgi:predicted GNAT family acetyltransferase
MSEPGRLPTDAGQLLVEDVPEESRYEARLDGSSQLAAIIEYRLLEGSIALLHTEVLSGFEGQGIGSRFALAVFEDLRARELTVIPRCPFIVRWLERHPEQRDVLARPLDPPATPRSTTLDPA